MESAENSPSNSSIQEEQYGPETITLTGKPISLTKTDALLISEDQNAYMWIAKSMVENYDFDSEFTASGKIICRLGNDDGYWYRATSVWKSGEEKPAEDMHFPPTHFLSLISQGMYEFSECVSDIFLTLTDLLNGPYEFDQKCLEYVLWPCLRLHGSYLTPDHRQTCNSCVLFDSPETKLAAVPWKIRKGTGQLKCFTSEDGVIVMEDRKLIFLSASMFGSDIELNTITTPVYFDADLFYIPCSTEEHACYVATNAWLQPKRSSLTMDKIIKNMYKRDLINGLVEFAVDDTNNEQNVQFLSELGVLQSLESQMENLHIGDGGSDLKEECQP